MKLKHIVWALAGLFLGLAALLFRDFGLSVSKDVNSILFVRSTYVSVLAWGACSAVFVAAGMSWLLAGLRLITRRPAEALSSEQRIGGWIKFLLGVLILYPGISIFWLFSERCIAHAPIMMRSSEKIVVAIQRPFLGQDLQVFDRRCLKFVAPYDFEDLLPVQQDMKKQKNGIYCSMDHAQECCCSEKAKKAFIPADNFPFDASVLLFAIAHGVVDLSRSGSVLRTWMSVN